METTYNIPQGHEAMIEGDKVIIRPKESEDERIRKIIGNTLRDAVLSERISETSYREMLAYLEKQKEQKPVPKFSVGDYVKDTNYKGAPLYQIVGIDKECYICEYRGDKAMGDRAVMHFTFDNPYLRLEPQPVEWGKEDEKIYNEALDALYYKDCNDKDDVLSALKGLCDLIADKRKVIPPYQRWKPSEEQMVALARATNRCVGVDDAKILVKLLEQLEKL